MAEFTDNFPEGMESNFTWGGNGENVGDLRVHMVRHQDGSVESISCWELSEAELEEVKRTGKVFLHVFGMHPPVYVGTSLDFGVMVNGETVDVPDAAVTETGVA